MRFVKVGSAAVVILVAFLVVSSLIGWTQAKSSVSTAPGGLRTFTWKSDSMPRILCNASAAARPVSGVLGGQKDARDPVWIEAPAGQHYSVIWPAGFTIAFTPAVELRNDTGVLIARAGDPIELGQTNLNEATGTFEDPYIAHGLSLGTGCYPYTY